MTNLPCCRPLPVIVALTALALGIGCGEQQAGGDFQDRAMDRVAAFQTELQAALRAALEEGGPVRAIDVCSEQAPAITQAASTDGLRIRRIGTRVRNHATNEPTPREREILAQFEALPGAERQQAVHIEGEGDQRALYAPIWVGNPLCLNCHGESEEMDAKVREVLAARYPDDEAVGYNMGELRGAFVVEIAK